MRTRLHVQEDINDLTAVLLVSASGTGFRGVRDRLLQSPAEEVVPGLIAAMGRSMQDARAFDRTARLLAQIGGDEAFSALSQHVRTSRRFPRISVRALSQCDHPQVFEVLLDLIRLPSPQPQGIRVRVIRRSPGNRKKQEAAIRYLGRAGKGRAVEPLCALVLGQEPPTLRSYARSALTAMGRPEALAKMVLAHPTLSISERVTGIASISEVWRFDPQRFLDRQVVRLTGRDGRLSPDGLQAAACAAGLRDRTTLLRASEHKDESSLLRAASGPGIAGGDDLLRASDRPGEDASTPNMSWWRRLARAISGGG